MKAVKNFSKAFLVCAIFSCAVILFGIAGMVVKGVNLGIDFQPGLIEEVRIAPPAIDVTYDGFSTVSLEVSNTGLDVVISGTGSENKTENLVFAQYPTISELAAALNTIDGINAVVRSSANAESYGLYLNSAVSARLSSDVAFHVYVPETTSSVTIDGIRETVASVKGVQVKELGSVDSRSYQIRAQVKSIENTEGSYVIVNENQILQDEIIVSLQNAYGAENVAIIKTDFVGSSMSEDLAVKSILLGFLTILLIWLYATVRFHWDFALGAVVALVHDFLVMFTFISWMQIEFSTTTLAAVLTIFGYSINATVVILDRVRFNLKNVKTNKFNDILNKSLTETLNRSIITTITTLFASLSLVFFTTGSIHDFAVVLTIGLLSGCYSSLFISSGFISFVRRNWQGGENANRVRPRKETAHVVKMPEA